jgi:serine/threonine protein kinase/Tfp pilus assembly protein PilF
MNAEQRLAEKLDAWQESQSGGVALMPEDLCGDANDLLPELSRRVAVLRRFESLMDYGAEATDEFRAEADTSHPVQPLDTPEPASLEKQLGPVPGMEFGGYRIVELLGKGGMGCVYRATDPALRRDVALKVMKPEVAAKPKARERFLREARAMAALHHDHVAPIYQVGEVADVPFLVMPLLSGEPLATRLAREGALPPGDVLRIGRESAAGLAVAHARGLIHRDVKPANIWLETIPDEAENVAPKWRVKVLDFGLAREQSGADAMTQEGVVIGSPAYMSPEQIDGQTPAPRSDLFSLGTVLYECATGQLPFKGTTLTAILAAVSGHHPPSAREVNPDVPVGLAELISQLQAKSPAARPASAQAVVQAIRALESQQPTLTRAEPQTEGVTEPSQSRRRPRTIGCSVTVTIAAMLLVSLVGLIHWRRLETLNRQTAVAEAESPATLPTAKIDIKEDPAHIRLQAVNPMPGMAITLDNKAAKAHWVLATALRDKGLLDEAVTEYRKALDLDSKLFEAHHNLGLVLAQTGRFDDAIEAYRAALAIAPRHALTHCDLGIALHEKGLVDDATKEYRAAIDLDPMNAVAHYHLGNALKAQRQRDEAIKEYRAALALDPRFARAHNNLGVALRDKGERDEPIIMNKGYRGAITSYSPYTNPYAMHTFSDKGQLDEAIREFRAALSLDPKDAQVHINLGNALKLKGQLDEAIREYRAALALNPKDAQVHNNLGNALYDRQLDAHGAKLVIRSLDGISGFLGTSEVLFPNTPQPRFLSELDEAIREYRAAIELKPDYAEAHCNLGYVLRQQGKYAEALAALRQGHALGSKRPGWRYPSAQWVKDTEVQQIKNTEVLKKEEEKKQ